MSVPDVRHAPDRDRFEIFLDGTRAGYVEYTMKDTAFDLMSAHVLPEFEGHGVGSSQIVESLKQIRELGGDVLPHCPFIPKVIRDNPEFLDLVPETERAFFGLS